MPREIKIPEGESRGSSEAPYTFNNCFGTFCRINGIDVDPDGLNIWAFQSCLASADDSFTADCNTASNGGEDVKTRCKLPNIPVKCNVEEASQYFAPHVDISFDGCSVEKPYPFPLGSNFVGTVPDDRFPGSITFINVKIAQANMAVWREEAELLLLCTSVKEMNDNNIKQRMKQKGYPGTPKLILKMLKAYCRDIRIDWSSEAVIKARDKDAFISYHTTAVSTPGVIMKFIEDTEQLGESLLGKAQVDIVKDAFKLRHDARAADGITTRSKMIVAAYRSATGTAIDDWHQGNAAVENANAVEYKKIADAFRIYFTTGSRGNNKNLMVTHEQGALYLKSVADNDLVSRQESAEMLEERTKLISLSDQAGYDIRAGEVISDAEYTTISEAIKLEKDQAGMKRLVKAKKANQVFEAELSMLGKSRIKVYVDEVVSIAKVVLDALQMYWKGLMVVCLITIIAVFVTRLIISLFFDTASNAAYTGVGIFSTLYNTFSNSAAVAQEL